MPVMMRKGAICLTCMALLQGLLNPSAATVRAPRVAAKGWTAFTAFGLHTRDAVRSANPGATSVEVEKVRRHQPSLGFHAAALHLNASEQAGLRQSCMQGNVILAVGPARLLCCSWSPQLSKIQLWGRLSRDKTHGWAASHQEAVWPRLLY